MKKVFTYLLQVSVAADATTAMWILPYGGIRGQYFCYSLVLTESCKSVYDEISLSQYSRPY